MGDVGAPTDASGMITHSICDECADNLEFQLGVSLRRYLNSLKMPICLIDDAGAIILANTAALELPEVVRLQTEAGEWPGKIYECSHARLPEKCSQTIHCSGCTIRFSVTETFTSGRELVSVPALINGCTSSPTQKCDYLISTKLVGGIVHLKIERIR
jgi:hypothetical protein